MCACQPYQTYLNPLHGLLIHTGTLTCCFCLLISFHLVCTERCHHCSLEWPLIKLVLWLELGCAAGRYVQHKNPWILFLHPLSICCTDVHWPAIDDVQRLLVLGQIELFDFCPQVRRKNEPYIAHLLMQIRPVILCKCPVPIAELLARSLGDWWQ